VFMFSTLFKDLKNRDGDVKLVQMILIAVYVAVATAALINALISITTFLDLPFANDSSVAFNAAVNIRNLVINLGFAILTWGFYLIRRKSGR